MLLLPEILEFQIKGIDVFLVILHSGHLLPADVLFVLFKVLEFLHVEAVFQHNVRVLCLVLKLAAYQSVLVLRQSRVDVLLGYSGL